MSSTASRSGPRTDLDVRDALLDTAERLYGDKSIDGVSLRSIAREAGVGSAAVFYHFESKEQLTRAVVERRATRYNDGIRRRCGAILEAEAPAVRDLVDAILVPLTEMINEDPGGALAWLKTYSWLAQVQDPAYLDLVRTEPRVDRLFLRAMERVLGHGRPLPPAVQRRGGIALFSIMQALSRADTSGFGSGALVDGALDPEYVEQLGIFATAGLIGSVTPPQTLRP
ncbi:TetR/AcrR family transcriptional regulator [Marmoricola sp. RAF53]|uniref:TetR/AcrR family transcriptional regulator n=1 Tax=Marmoricola sp. RAF53 TaxID=3233059 RepID=UPI003F950600